MAVVEGGTGVVWCGSGASGVGCSYCVLVTLSGGGGGGGVVLWWWWQWWMKVSCSWCCLVMVLQFMFFGSLHALSFNCYNIIHSCY